MSSYISQLSGNPFTRNGDIWAASDGIPRRRDDFLAVSWDILPMSEDLFAVRDDLGADSDSLFGQSNGLFPIRDARIGRRDRPKPDLPSSACP